MSKAVHVIHYEEQAVGRRIKSTKKHFLWKFSLDSITYTIDIFSSKFSGKRTLKVNGDIYFEGKKQGKIFHQSLEIGTHSIIIIEANKSFDLRIDGISFNLLKKQSDFGINIESDSSNLMSNQLIPEQQEDWEKAAKPYDIIVREGLNTTTREKLPIIPILSKKPRGRLTVQNPTFDPRFMFGSEKQSPIEPNMLGGEDFAPKPRAYSSYMRGVEKSSGYENFNLID
ncbi:hypothetical protein SteCoe_1115 [Stentor coeruleus]|uniref:Uncharacterized protein n=1 Tax=Stentor coeruleus TaxID=5963 RepID=A0A1R2D2L8_9CILI|nr:hypothetical protein SteCoe_1115 [Stentor coeruleus]